MKHLLVALVAISASTGAIAGDRIHSRTFNGDVRNQKVVQTIAMKRTIAAISDVKIEGSAGEAQCGGEGTQTLVMRFKPEGLVGRPFNAELSCKVTLADAR